MPDYLSTMTPRQRDAYFQLSKNFESVIGEDIAHASVCDRVLSEIDEGDLRPDSVVLLAKVGYGHTTITPAYYSFLHALHSLGMELTDPTVAISGITYHLTEFHKALKAQQSN